MKKQLSYVLLAGVLAASLYSCKKDDDTVAPSVKPVTTTTELANALQQIVEQSEIPGFSISIVKNNSILYQEGFGYADVQAKKPFTNATQQQVASVSKTFAGAATLKAIELGLFNLDTEVNTLLPVNIVNPHQPNHPILIKHLVTHTSGIIDNPGVYFSENYFILPGQNTATEGGQILMNQFYIEQRPKGTLEDILAEYLLVDGDLYSTQNFANKAPGQYFQYSNFGTALLGYIIEITSGKPYSAFVEQHVLLPLNMVNSTFNIDQVDFTQVSKWYLNSEIQFPFFGNDSYVEGGLFTTNNDLGNYLLDMVKGAQSGSTTLFSEASYSTLFNSQLSSGVIPNDFAENIGVFWFKEGDYVYHGGNDFGASSHLKINKKQGWGYSFISNLDAVVQPSVFQEIMRDIDHVIVEFISNN